jgi:hypothetical protein
MDPAMAGKMILLMIAKRVQFIVVIFDTKCNKDCK